MHESLQATKHALESHRFEGWDTGTYQNQRGVRGITIEFRHGGQHHRISIHNCQSVPDPAHLAEAISGIRSIDERRMGTYVNRRWTPGFYATARSSRNLNGSTDHWYMIVRSDE